MRDVRHVPRASELVERGMRDERGQPAAVADGDDAVARAVDDERRHGDASRHRLAIAAQRGNEARVLLLARDALHLAQQLARGGAVEVPPRENEDAQRRVRSASHSSIGSAHITHRSGLRGSEAKVEINTRPAMPSPSRAAASSTTGPPKDVPRRTGRSKRRA